MTEQELEALEKWNAHREQDALRCLTAVRDDIPALIAEVRRLQAERDEWKRLASVMVNGSKAEFAAAVHETLVALAKERQ